jgi:hypothetical protein
MWETINKLLALKKPKVILYRPVIDVGSSQSFVVELMRGLKVLETCELEVSRNGPCSGREYNDPFDYYLAELLPSTRAIIKGACRS